MTEQICKISLTRIIVIAQNINKSYKQNHQNIIWTKRCYVIHVQKIILNISDVKVFMQGNKKSIILTHPVSIMGYYITILQFWGIKFSSIENYSVNPIYIQYGQRGSRIRPRSPRGVLILPAPSRRGISLRGRVSAPAV